jgi:enediyne biosynthesis protein E4
MIVRISVTFILFGLACQPSTPPVDSSSPASIQRSRSLSTSSDSHPAVSESDTPAMSGMHSPLAAGAVDALSPGEPSAFKFRDVTDQTGIGFVHCSGNDAEKHFPANLGSGVALLDYDGDGKLDIYLVSLRMFPVSAPSRSMGNRLYRNLGNLKFEDVTERARIGYNRFCHGVAVGDVNNDGHPDMLLTNVGPLVLYLNNGDGTFHDGSTGAGLSAPYWSNGAAFLDYDGDGILDLYVSCYGQWRPEEEHEFCGDRKRNIRVFCSPYSLTPERHYLFRGHGDGTFEETTERAGILRRDGRGLGVIAADVNSDGRTDLYVANDGCPNFLFLNRGDGTFEDISESSGAATDQAGQVQGSMGVDVQDVDGDGRPELFVTNFRGQYNTLYHNNTGLNFLDVSAQTGIVADSLPFVGWGCALADFDNDGWPDMLVANGEVDDNLKEFGQNIEYKQPVIIWGNRKEGHKFVRASDPGDFFRVNHPSRGAAFGDLDNDGDLDVVINRQDMKPAVLINESNPKGHWIRFQIEGRWSNRSAIGAAVTVHAGSRAFYHQVKGGGSYLSSNDPRILIGLGTITQVDRVLIRWPRGGEAVLTNLAIEQTHRLCEPPR